MIPAFLRPTRLEHRRVAVAAVLFGMGLLSLAQLPDRRSVCVTAFGCTFASVAIAVMARSRHRDRPHRSAIVAPMGFLLGAVIAVMVLDGLRVESIPGSGVRAADASTLVIRLLAMPLLVSLLGLIQPNHPPDLRAAATATWLVAVGALSIWCAAQLSPLPGIPWLGGALIVAGAARGAVAIARNRRRQAWLRSVARGDIAGLRLYVSGSGTMTLEQWVRPTYRVEPRWEVVMDWPSPTGVLTAMAKQLAIAFCTLCTVALLLALCVLPFVFFGGPS
ncbi:hypothetical protein LVJ94_33810 [Pendulispora rubella]|uniref:Uncharacterized protein n=1 Tax=Pendulispora rubella TaxID=2741070 RepID=A0ABZ2KT73_9BACT